MAQPDSGINGATCSLGTTMKLVWKSHSAFPSYSIMMICHAGATYLKSLTNVFNFQHKFMFVFLRTLQYSLHTVLSIFSPTLYLNLCAFFNI